jgi:hypothetical protein
MGRTYEPKKKNIVIEIFWILVGVAVAVFATYFIGRKFGWIPTDFHLILIGAIFLGLGLLNILLGSRETLITSEQGLTVKKGKKEELYSFDEYGFSYKVETVDGNTDYWLYAIKHGDNYPTKTLDCNYIGGKEFYEILDDLKISGKSAPAQKLHAEKKA